MLVILEKLYPRALYNSFSRKARRDTTAHKITKETIFAEKIGSLYWSNPRTEIEEAITAIGVVILPGSNIPWLNRLTWLAIILTWILARTVFAEVYKRNYIPLNQQKLWGYFYAICDFISALIWSSWLIYSQIFATAAYTAILKVVFVSFATNVVAALYAFFPLTSIVFAVTMSIAVIISFLLEITPLNIAAAIFVVFYIYVLIGLGKNTEDRYNRLQTLRMELQAQKDAAERANLAKTRFLAAASHDLRQPLHALSLFSELLEEETKNAATQKTTKNIRDSIGSLENLLDSILDISKLDASVIKPTISEFYLTDIFKTLEAEYSVLAKEKKLIFSINAPEIIVKSDITLLEQILRNLLDNAIKYTAKGEVKLTATKNDNQVCIAISDTGIGIPKSYQDTVFEEFFQIDNQQREREKGLGLGLAIVHRVIELLGHKLELISQPNKGTTFVITAPAGTGQINKATKILQEASYNSPLNLTIWLVEDNAEVANAQHSLLLKWGCQCQIFRNKNSVLQALETHQNPPDVILADFKSGKDSNGAEVIILIRDHYNRNIPALIITGDTSPAQLTEIKGYGIDVIHKPAKRDKIRQFLAQCNKIK